MDKDALLVSYVLCALRRPVEGFSELAELMFLIENRAPTAYTAGGAGLTLTRSKADGLVDWTPLEDPVTEAAQWGFVRLRAKPVHEKEGLLLTFEGLADRAALRRMVVDVLGPDLTRELDSAIDGLAPLSRNVVFEHVYGAPG